MQCCRDYDLGHISHNDGMLLLSILVHAHVYLSDYEKALLVVLYYDVMDQKFLIHYSVPVGNELSTCQLVDFGITYLGLSDTLC